MEQLEYWCKHGDRGQKDSDSLQNHKDLGLSLDSISYLLGDFGELFNLFKT